MDYRKPTKQELAETRAEMQKALAVNLRRLRKVKGLSQARLAEKAGVSLSAYRRMEAGGGRTGLATLIDLAEVLGTNWSRLTDHERHLHAARLVSEKPLRSRPQILVDAAYWLDGYLEMEVGRTDGVPYRFADFDPKECDNTAS